MIFKEFCTGQMENSVREQPEQDIILKNILNIMDAIDQSMNEPIWETLDTISKTHDNNNTKQY